MWKANRHARTSALPAIAAALALSSTPALASKVKPIVDLGDRTQTAPASATPAPKHESSMPNETTMELGGGALALLALGGGAYALMRRRRHDDELAEDTYEPLSSSAAEPASAPRHDPVVHEQSAILAPEASAFSWGNRTHADAREDLNSDRHQDESWVERAYRGPSEDNPSQSLRRRLKRAAFFDKRDREVAAGEAEPIDADAGLPEAMDEPAPPLATAHQLEEA